MLGTWWTISYWVSIRSWVGCRGTGSRMKRWVRRARNSTTESRAIWRPWAVSCFITSRFYWPPSSKWLMLLNNVCSPPPRSRRPTWWCSSWRSYSRSTGISLSTRWVSVIPTSRNKISLVYKYPPTSPTYLKPYSSIMFTSLQIISIFHALSTFALHEGLF